MGSRFSMCIRLLQSWPDFSGKLKPHGQKTEQMRASEEEVSWKIKHSEGSWSFLPETGWSWRITNVVHSNLVIFKFVTNFLRFTPCYVSQEQSSLHKRRSKQSWKRHLWTNLRKHRSFCRFARTKPHCTKSRQRPLDLVGTFQHTSQRQFPFSPLQKLLRCDERIPIENQIKSNKPHQTPARPLDTQLNFLSRQWGLQVTPWGFMNGGLLDAKPRDHLQKAGKLPPSSLSYLIDERDTITRLHVHFYVYIYMSIYL